MGNSQKACSSCVFAVVAVTLTVSSPVCQEGQYTAGDDCVSCVSVCNDRNSFGYSQCSKFCADYNEECDSGEYYDVNLSRCDLCSSVCDHHEARGTSEECKTHCPNEFAKSTKDVNSCPGGSYYDPYTTRCQSCLILCSNHKLLEETPRCMQDCKKDYHNSIPKPTSKAIPWLKILGSLIGGSFVILMFIGVIKHIQRKFCTTPTVQVSIDQPPLTTYIPIADPVHDQCTADDGYISLQTSTGSPADDERSGIVCEEEEKFPRAFPELPSSVRPDM